MISLTQILTFELGRHCNLATQHSKCPISCMPRNGKPLTDDIIVSTAVDAYNRLGFEGLVSWSFYNEPLLQFSRMFNLMRRIRSLVSKSRFLLWTNGTILIKDQQMDLFEQIYITDYTNTSEKELEKYFTAQFFYKGNPQFDDRLNHYTDPNKMHCTLPLDNFLISDTGEVYICCHDWKNEVKIGNLFDCSLKDLEKIRWEIIKKIAGKQMTDAAPAACLGCKMKWETTNFDEKIRTRALEEIGNL